MMEEDYVDPKAWHGDTWADVKRAKAAPSAPFPLSRFSSLILRSRIIIILWKLSFDNNLCKSWKTRNRGGKIDFSSLFPPSSTWATLKRNDEVAPRHGSTRGRVERAAVSGPGRFKPRETSSKFRLPALLSEEGYRVRDSFGWNGCFAVYKIGHQLSRS